MIPERYDPKAIEGKWQEQWEQRKAFKAVDPHKDPEKKPKFYCLCMFPYPSGQIHMGHTRNYTIGDAIARYHWMRGFNVLHPYGFDAFGMPAENAAIERGIHPGDWTFKNIEQMRVGLRSMGLSCDWDREIITCVPEYYRWEQLFFRHFYEKGLAYQKTGSNNWCGHCQTVLANEQVHEGRCWRCDMEVEKKELTQWYLRITDYADELLSGHQKLEGKWPDRVLEMQKNWIGRSFGCRIVFQVEKRKDQIEVFTTRSDTLFGVTFVTLAPAHPLAESLCIGKKEKNELIELKKEVEQRRLDEVATTKKGFFTGSFSVHPLTSEKIPIWIGDFVVVEYGTGAVMAVPGHDQRDFEFAKAHGLKIKRVILPLSGKPEEPMIQAFIDYGVLTDSGDFSGLKSGEAIEKIANSLHEKTLGGKVVQFRLRDWGISRQRYWGAPVPIIYCDDCGTVLVPEKDLPVELPKDVTFDSVGNPLEQHPSFKKTTCPQCGKAARRETDTMDTFVESSWYYARYLSPRNDRRPFEKEAADSWLPVDYYIGGIEHACMHLLYARFFHKALRDWDYLSYDEPFTRLLTQGMVIKDGAKMSKSKGNIVTPIEIFSRYGADTARLFCLFAAPPEKDLDWSDAGVEGCYRFLQRIWRLCFQFGGVLGKADLSILEGINDERLLTLRRKTHWLVKKVTEDMESCKFNTAIAACMELVNEMYLLLSEKADAFSGAKSAAVLREGIENLVLCLTPFSPHVCEELWSHLGMKGLVSKARWPQFDPSLLLEDTFILVVQVNGKVRDKISVPKNISEAEIRKQVLLLPKVVSFTEGKVIRKVVYVRERLANVVASN